MCVCMCLCVLCNFIIQQQLRRVALKWSKQQREWEGETERAAVAVQVDQLNSAITVRITLTVNCRQAATTQRASYREMRGEERARCGGYFVQESECQSGRREEEAAVMGRANKTRDALLLWLRFLALNAFVCAPVCVRVCVCLWVSVAKFANCWCDSIVLVLFLLLLRVSFVQYFN